MRDIIVEGRSFDEAVAKGLGILGAERDEVKTELIEEGQSIGGVVLKPCKVYIVLKEDTKDSVKTKTTTYTLEYEEEGIFLTVYPAQHGISKGDETRIIEYIKRKEIKDINSKAVFRAMHTAPGQKVKVAEKQEEELIDEDIEIQIADKGMKVYARLLPPYGGKQLTIQEVEQLLNQKGIVFGIDSTTIRKMLHTREYGVEYCIAQGQKPENGRDAKLIYHIDLNKDPKPEIKEDGTVDYRHLDLIVNVRRGQILVSLSPATPGVSGHTVMGQKVMAKSGKSLALPRGRNVVLSEDKLQLLAEMDGKAEMIGGKIHVYAIYEVKGNVDNATGNIDFIGNVIINGNVLTGFKVKAGGYIEVRGVVEGAQLEAKADVILKQGMQGMSRGSIHCDGNVIARFIENGNVQAKGNIIAEAIMHSNVSCGGRIQVAGKKGLIVGGSISAGMEICAETIGSPMATVTELEVGTSPLLREEYALLSNKKEKLEKELNKTDKILQLLSKMNSATELPPDKVQLRLKAIRAKMQHQESIPDIRARMVELEDVFKAVARGKISVRNIIYPGIKITIGTSTLYIKDEEKRVTFNREHGDIVRTAFQG